MPDAVGPDRIAPPEARFSLSWLMVPPIMPAPEDATEAFAEHEVAKRRDDALRRALNTPKPRRKKNAPNPAGRVVKNRSVDDDPNRMGGDRRRP